MYFTLIVPRRQFETLLTTERCQRILAEIAGFLLKSVNVSNCFSGACIMLRSSGSQRPRVVGYLIIRHVSSKCVKLVSGGIRIGFIVGILDRARPWVVQYDCSPVVDIISG